jgi:hypothetical protein
MTRKRCAADPQLNAYPAQFTRIFVHAALATRLAGLEHLDHAAAVRDRQSIQTQRVLFVTKGYWTGAPRNEGGRRWVIQKCVDLVSLECVSYGKRRRVKRRVQIVGSYI